MVNLASDAVQAENPALRRVLGGISPIDPDFMRDHAATVRARATSTSSPYMGFRSTGITGRSTNGPTSSTKSGR